MTELFFELYKHLLFGDVLLVILFSAASAWLLLHVFVPQLRSWLPDQPNARSSHTRPTPRGGGFAFVAVASVGSLIGLSCGHESAAVAMPLVAAPIAVVGFLDDHHNLPSSWRYLVQLFTAIFILTFSPIAQDLNLHFELGNLLTIPISALLIIAVTAVINFTNFMDGIDGLVAGCMAVAISTSAIQLSLPWPIWALVGALLGFLLWNWSPAKLFMGDVGSTFLGAVFAGLVLQASSWPEAFGLLLVATPLLGDAFLCVPRRRLAGQQVFQAHRLHLFQRLHQAGWPHARVSSLYIAATAVLSMALLWGGLPWVISLAALELIIGVWLDRQVAVPFAVASRN